MVRRSDCSSGDFSEALVVAVLAWKSTFYPAVHPTDSPCVQDSWNASKRCLTWLWIPCGSKSDHCDTSGVLSGCLLWLGPLMVFRPNLSIPWEFSKLRRFAHRLTRSLSLKRLCARIWGKQEVPIKQNFADAAISLDHIDQVHDV